MEINEEKRNKFMEYAGKRVNNVLHDIQILEPMSRSNSYDFTKQDVEEMFNAMEESLNNVKVEYYKKFEEKARTDKKVFSFGASNIVKATNNESVVNNELNNEEVVDSNNEMETVNNENIDTNIF